MIEDFRLRVFEAVAKTGSFTAAARQLGVSQPAVSQNITELEKQMEVKLVARSRTEVSLTAEGKRLRKYVHQILHWYDAANTAFGLKDGKITPSEIQLDGNREALLWSYDGDIHITFPKE